MEVTKPWKEQSPKPVVVPPELGARSYVWSWSPDGRKLAGNLRKADSYIRSDSAIYSLESGKFERLTPSGFDPVWLGDGRRLLFQDQGKLYLIDAETRKLREILSVGPHDIGRADALPR